MSRIFIFGTGGGNTGSRERSEMILRDPTINDRQSVYRGTFPLRDVKLGPNGLERYNHKGELISVAGKPVER